MSSIKLVERECFEELFGMASGYVLDFSNRTFSELFRESAGLDIYADKYATNGDSKARRLRAFVELEPDAVVGKVLADLLEFWRYKTPNPNGKDADLFARATAIVERLLGKSNRPRDSGEVFLNQQFGDIPFSSIPTATHLASVLDSRLNEAIRCIGSDAPLAVIFHCGSILEGLLLGVAIANPRHFNEAPNSPKDKAGSVRQFQDWTLAQLIDVACETGHLTLDVKKFSHAVRDFRNYIHPYEQMSSRFDPDKHTAEICLQVLKAAMACLAGRRLGNRNP